MPVVLRAALAASLCFAASSAVAQEAPPIAGMAGPPPGFTPVPGYLGDSAPDPAVFLPPPPAADSTDGQAEMQVFRDTRVLEGTARWDMAAGDAAGGNAAMFGAFACALGAEIDPDAAPRTTRMIRRVLSDVSPIIGQQKDRFSKPRPFTLEDGATCVDAENLRESGSYPSGHSAVGWSWALVLAELAPDRAAQIAARGRAFGESRVVCGVHYPSDVEGGQLATMTVMIAAQSAPDFAADRDAARAELDALRASAPAPDQARCAGEAELTAQRPW